MSSKVETPTQRKPDVKYGSDGPPRGQTPIASACSPEVAFETGLKMIKDIDSVINELQLGSKMRKESWLKDTKRLSEQTFPTTTIAICGATGAGKSSLINAILDDNIVPTSGVRVITEISYHRDKTIAGDITFLSVKEWKDELSILLSDLKDEGGSMKESLDLRTEAGIAWHKVRAVYPELTFERLAHIKSADDIIGMDQSVLEQLGSTVSIVAKNSKKFDKKISKYIESRGKNVKIECKEDNGRSLWPLIRQVRVRCSSEVLQTGATLVDLPGVADANAARSSIAKEYMKNCDCIWIVAPITRAIDDKVAKDLLGDVFKSQFMNGGFSDIDGKITFVATKCDDISCSEVIRSLRVNDPQLRLLEDRITEAQNAIKEMERKKKHATKNYNLMTGKCQDMKKKLAQHKANLDTLGDVPLSYDPTFSDEIGKKRKPLDEERQPESLKRQRTADSASYPGDDCLHDTADGISANSGEGSDSSSNDDTSVVPSSTPKSKRKPDAFVTGLTKSEHQARLQEVEEMYRTLDNKEHESLRLLGDAISRLSELEKGLLSTEKEKNAYCSRKRSDYSRKILKEDFRAGLKELDDAVAEKEDPANFDPSQHLRAYDHIDLPVFTVSARDYVRITKQVKGDGSPNCFVDIRDTEIPALQEWCRSSMTSKSRHRFARAFQNRIRAVANSVKNYIESFAEIGEGDRRALQSRWQTSRGVSGSGVKGRLDSAFNEAIKETIDDLQAIFKERLENMCRDGARKASQKACEVCDAFADSMHWITYSATLRRDGEWKRNLNEELSLPMIRRLASSWAQVFKHDLLSPLESKANEALKKLLTEFEGSCSIDLRERARKQGQVCRAEATVALQGTVDIVHAQIMDAQKDVSRRLAPTVRDQMNDGYRRAKQEKGRGSIMRRKTILHDHIDSQKEMLFMKGASVLSEGLDEIRELAEVALHASLRALSKKVELTLSVLWEKEDRDSRCSPQDREAAVTRINETLLQLSKMDEVNEANPQV